MTDCNTGFRVLPQIYAIEIAKYFQMELQLGKMSSWGIAKYRQGIEDGCSHWMVCVSMGEKRLIPAMCFETRKEAVNYCEQVSQGFEQACRVLFGIAAQRLSSN